MIFFLDPANEQFLLVFSYIRMINNSKDTGMKKIALFGGSGKTGLKFIEKASEKGHQIKALLRKPEKIKGKSENLLIIEGDLLDEQKVAETIKNTDVVVNLSGHVKGSPSDLQLKSTEYIIAAMKKNGIRRLITLTGGGVRDEKKDKPGFIDKLIVFIMMHLAGKQTKVALLDGRKHVEYIKSQQDIEYTIVRAPRLNDKPAQEHIEVGNVGTVDGIQLSREDLAAFILTEVEQNKHINEMPFVTNG